MGQTSRFGGGPRLVTVQCVENSLILLVSDRVLAQIATTRPQIWEAVQRCSISDPAICSNSLPRRLRCHPASESPPEWSAMRGKSTKVANPC
jgi:hypothetical protein